VTDGLDWKWRLFFVGFKIKNRNACSIPKIIVPHSYSQYITACRHGF